MPPRTRTRESVWASPELRGAQVRLRSPSPADEAAFVALRLASREFLAPWEADAPDHDAFGSERFRRFLVRRADRRRWLIERLDDGRMVGALSLTRIDASERSATIGFWIGVDHARRGLMGEAAHSVLAWSASELRLALVRAFVLPENEPSRALLGKLGFTRQPGLCEPRAVAGRLRDHELWTCALTNA